MRLPKAFTRKADIEALRTLGIDVRNLTDAEISEGARIAAQCTRNHCFPGANARRPAAIAAWEAFAAKHGAGA
jgi:hypothetical protein